MNDAFERHGVILAYLYSSQARSDAGPLSDVDVRVLYCTSDADRVCFETTALRDYVDTEPLRKIERSYVIQRFGFPARRRV